MSFTQLGRERETMRVLCDCTLPFVNEWVWSKVHSNGTVFSFSQEQGRLKSSYSLSSCLFEALNVCHLRDQPLTDKQTDKLTDRQTDR